VGSDTQTWRDVALLTLFGSSFQSYAKLFTQGAKGPIELVGEVNFACSSKDIVDSAEICGDSVQIRHIHKRVMLSMDPIVDEYGLPLCIACTLTPLEM
jgi:hypothetical protein